MRPRIPEAKRSPQSTYRVRMEAMHTFLALYGFIQCLLCGLSPAAPLLRVSAERRQCSCLPGLLRSLPGHAQTRLASRSSTTTRPLLDLSGLVLLTKNTSRTRQVPPRTGPELKQKEDNKPKTAQESARGQTGGFRTDCT